MKIIQDLSKNKNIFNGVNPCKYITIHQTANTGKGANALNHAKYINNGSSATWHYTVDSERIVQHFRDSVQCWHCGDGKGKGNTESIGIELCVNSDGNYMHTINNAIELVRHLMKVHNIPVSNVVQHNKWSGKNCPSEIRSSKQGFNWNDFIKSITPSKTVQIASQPVPNSSPNIHTLALEVLRGVHGNGEIRKKKLGSSYNAVQKEVNRILNKHK